MTVPRNPAVWFEIPVRDLARARAFYEALLGVALAVESGPRGEAAWFPMNDNAHGATGALVAGGASEPGATGTLVYLAVDEVEAALARGAAAGGEILLAREGIGEHGFIGWIADPDGNRVGVHALV